MRKNLFSKAMAMLLSAGLVCTMLPAAEITAAESAVNEPAEQILSLSTTTTTPEAAAATTTETSAAVTPTVTTAIETSDTSYTSTYATTTVPDGSTVMTTLRTTETISPDETELHIEIEKLDDCAEVDFGQSLENVYSVMIDMNNVDLNDGDEPYLRFDVSVDGPDYQVLYPLNVYSYSSMDKWWAQVQIANNFSYATVRLYEGGEGTVSWLDTFDPDLADALFAEVKASELAVIEIVNEKTMTATAVTTSVSYNTDYLPEGSLFWSSWVLAVGERTSHYAKKSEFSGNVISVEADSGGGILILEEYTEYDDRIEFTVDPVAAGNDILRFVCDDGSEYELKIEVFAPSVTTTATTVTTALTSKTNVYDYTVPVGASVTVPVFDEDLSGTVETVTVDSENTVVEVTKTENLANLINLHVNALSVGEDTIRLYLDDGSEFTVRITVTEAKTTSATTAATVSTTVSRDATITTFPTTSYSTTTTPPHTTITATTTSTVPTGTNTGVGGEETGTTVGTIATTGTTVGPDTGRHNADANNDGSIDLDDAVCVLTVYACKSAGMVPEGMTEEQTAYADADGDGKVTLDDAVKILTYYSMKAAGLDPSWTQII